MNTGRPCRRAARSNDSRFSTVLFSARLAATRPQAMPPGLRKSFCKSVSTSAVRRSTVIPGLGRSMSLLLCLGRKDKTCIYRFMVKKGYGSSAEALLPREAPEGSHPGVAEQAPGLPLGDSPARDGLLEQGPPRLRQAVG